MTSHRTVAAMLLIAVAALTGVYAPPAVADGNKAEGMSVNESQLNVDWSAAKAAGISFVIAKATEGDSHTSSQFNSQYTGATNAGLIRGAYHFARPDRSSGATQANYFLSHGGGWSADGPTLPGTVDLEKNPEGPKTCYGISAKAMVDWIRDFSDTYYSKTSRYPTIYTTTGWWKECTGNDSSFGATNPLTIARYAPSPGALPAGWGHFTFWEYADQSSRAPGYALRFNGDEANLASFARG